MSPSIDFLGVPGVFGRDRFDVSLHVFIAYRNLVRKRFNKDSFSEAEKLGWIRRRLRPTEVLGWRQVFGKRSIHPLARNSESIESVLAKS